MSDASACKHPGEILSRTLTRRDFLTRSAAFSAAMASGLLTGCGGRTASLFKASDAPASAAFSSLKAAAASANLLFGAAAHHSVLQQDPEFAAQIANNCGVLVAEDELKWETSEPEPGVFNFAPGDWMVSFAAQNGMRFRGHCLVWHQQLPAWAGAAVTAADAEQQLTRHISETVGHFAGRLHSWDVVNEAIEPTDGRPDALRNTVWLAALGPRYIELAFRAAAQADPNAVLVYNDYGLEYDTPDADRRRDAVLRLLSGLKAGGAPVHALGIQAHLHAEETRFSASKLTQFLAGVAALGLKIFITEMDVSDQTLPADPATRDRIVAGSYQQFLGVVLREPAVAAVITWGLSDRYTWLKQFSPRSDGQPVRPLPLNSDLQPKAAWNAMMQSFAQAPARSA